MKIESEYQGIVRKDDKWDCQHYLVKVKNGKRVVRLDFYKGMAHSDEPNINEVMSCMILEASSSDQPFILWCRDFGYSPDSISALKVYKACKAQAHKLAWLFPNGVPAALERKWREY